MSTPEQRARFIERMGGALTAAGLARLPSRVFAALLIDSDGRMTATEIAEAVGASAGSVSGAVRYLEQINMLHRERESGSRRDQFVVDDEVWHEAMLRHDEVYAPIISALTIALAGLADDDPARPRIALTMEFLEFVGREMDDVAKRWEEHASRLRSS